MNLGDKVNQLKKKVSGSGTSVWNKTKNVLSAIGLKFI